MQGRLALTRGFGIRWKLSGRIRTALALFVLAVGSIALAATPASSVVLSTGYLSRTIIGSPECATTSSIGEPPFVTIQTGLTCAAGDSASASSPDGSLAGTVTSASSSSPLGDICVYLYQVGNSTAATFATCTVTGGTYQFSGVTSGSYDVAFADPSGYYSTQWYNGTSTGASSQSGATPITVPSGNGTLSGINAAMVAVPDGSLAGTVTSASSSSPLGDICVYLYQVGNSTAATFATCTVTGGTYQFSGVTSGSYDVAFADPSGYYSTQWYNGTSTGASSQSGATPITVPSGNGTLSGINAAMVAVPDGSLAGTVTSASSSSPLGDICVYLYQVGNSTAATFATCTVTGGTYQLSGVTSGSYDVAFADPSGYYSTQWYNGTSTGASSQSGATPITVPSGNGTLSGINAAMVAVPDGSLAGTVTSASSSSPLGDICVYLYQVGNSTAATFATCTVTGGTYQLSGVTSGSYDVAFADPSGYYSTQWYNGTSTGASSQSGATPITVPSGNGTLSGINAAMVAVPDGSLAGTVTSASSSSPLGDICVYLYQVGNSTAATFATCTVTGGTYQLSGVTSGSYDVAFADPSGYYSTQWYNGTSTGASSQSGATPITVPSGNGTLSGINAAMALTVPWSLLFDSEFNGSSLDTSQWSTGWFGSGITQPVNSYEQECYDPAQVSVANGEARLDGDRQIGVLRWDHAALRVGHCDHRWTVQLHLRLYGGPHLAARLRRGR